MAKSTPVSSSCPAAPCGGSSRGFGYRVIGVEYIPVDPGSSPGIRHGLNIDATKVSGFINGYIIRNQQSVAAALATMQAGYLVASYETGEKDLVFTQQVATKITAINSEDLIKIDGATFYRKRVHSPTRIVLHYIDSDNEYNANYVAVGEGHDTLDLHLPAIFSRFEAQVKADVMLRVALASNTQLRCRLPLRYLGQLELFDRIMLGGAIWRINALSVDSAIDIIAYSDDLEAFRPPASRP